MGMGKDLRMEVTDWGILAIVIVVISLILLKIKSANPGNFLCSGQTYTVYNSTHDFCQTLANGSQNTSIGVTGQAIGTIVTGLSEPKNWLIIVIVGTIGFALVKMFTKGTSDM